MKAYKELLKVSRATEKNSRSCIEGLENKARRGEIEEGAYKELKKFRAGIEGCISAAERS